MKLEVGKTYRLGLADPHTAEIIFQLSNNDHDFVAVVTNYQTGNQVVQLYREDGNAVGRFEGWDLLEEPRTVWVNLYGPDSTGLPILSSVYGSEEAAKDRSDVSCIATVPITYQPRRKK